MKCNKAKLSSLLLAGLLTVTLCLGKMPLAAGASYTKYATTSGTWGFGNVEYVRGSPDDQYALDMIGNGGYIWGGGYATETGTITGVIINVRYQMNVAAVDDTLTLKYSLNGGGSFGAIQLTWVPRDVEPAWAVKNIDVSSDTSINGGSWDWSDIDNLQVYLTCTLMGGEGDASYVYVDTLYVSVTTAPELNFSVNASPSTLSVQQAGTVSTTVNVTLISGTAETVSLSGSWVGTAPAGVAPSFNPTSGTPNFGSTLTFSTTAAATTGTFTYRAIGTGGGVTRTADVFLTITQLTLPVPPVLRSPDNGTTLDTNTPTFDWFDAAGATSYTLVIATDNNFSNIVLTKSAVGSTAALSETEKLSYGTRYYWRVRGTNAAGSGDWSSTWSFTAKLIAPKVTTFEVAAGAAYTNDNTVQLTIAAQNAVEMSLSSDGIVWSDWETYQTSKSYTLPPGDGSKSIYIRVRDNVGDISQISVDSIALDQTSPSTTYSLSGDLGAEGYKGSVVVTLTSTDTTSGISSTTYRIDDGEWKTGDTFVVSSEGRHTIEYYSTDAAGNTETAKTLEVTVYTPTAVPPFLSQYWWATLSIIVVAGVVSTFIIRRVRLAGRLKRITREKAELLKLKREAETKYFRDGSISRDTFDTLIEDYERRKAELEKEERVLQAKVKHKKLRAGD